jgi:hypothetical protein
MFADRQQRISEPQILEPRTLMNLMQTPTEYKFSHHFVLLQYYQMLFGCCQIESKSAYMQTNSQFSTIALWPFVSSILCTEQDNSGHSRMY